jgi:mannose-1-phosphate guanylyltransferase
MWDDPASWPSAGNLTLNGFAYSELLGGPTDATSRLRWLRLEPQGYWPQPYRQLGKVLRGQGHDSDATDVAIESLVEQRRTAGLPRLERLWNRLLEVTIGYGYRPLRALWWIAAFVVFGTILFGCGHWLRLITPTEEAAYERFVETGEPPPHYPPFNAFVYSLENFLPVVELGQDPHWRPNPHHGLGGFIHRSAHGLTPGTIPAALLRWYVGTYPRRMDDNATSVCRPLGSRPPRLEFVETGPRPRKAEQKQPQSDRHPSFMISSPQNDFWALVLAGGDGTRLQDLTRLIAGTPIPKQYCRILGQRSLLEETLSRLEPLVARKRTLVIVNHDHLPLARSQVTGLPGANLVVQPANRDTGPGMLLALLALARREPDATVSVFPSDHFIRCADAFAADVTRMRSAVEAHPSKIVLLGVRPERPEPGYGYIVPLPARGHSGIPDTFGVARFEEKPSSARAAEIIRHGALWSSFIMTFRASRMLELLRRARPAELAHLQEASSSNATLFAAYHALEPWNFSRDFLARRAADLLVVRAGALGWSDWGTRESIERTLAVLGLMAPWHEAPPIRASA